MGGLIRGVLVMMEGIEAQTDCRFEDAFLRVRSRFRGSSLPRNNHVIMGGGSRTWGESWAIWCK
jgi:hypothetical protein